MKLWIRTQDKKRLCLVEDLYIHDNIRYKEVEETEIITDITGGYRENKIKKQEIDGYISCEIWGNNHLLGTYNTQEQGLKVLDDIQDKLLDNVIATNEDGYATLLENTCFYEMPKEEKKDDK